MALVYVNEETPITWLSSGGTELITLTSVAATAGRQGALRDFGVAARPLEHFWRAFVVFATAPVVAESIDIYWKTSDGTNPDNDDGTGDIAVSSVDKLRNLQYLGSIIVDEASATPVFVASGKFDISARHGGPVFWNATADALSSTALDHGFSITPIPMEIQ